MWFLRHKAIYRSLSAQKRDGCRASLKLVSRLFHSAYPRCKHIHSGVQNGSRTDGQREIHVVNGSGSGVIHTDPQRIVRQWLQPCTAVENFQKVCRRLGQYTETDGSLCRIVSTDCHVQLSDDALHSAEEFGDRVESGKEKREHFPQTVVAFRYLLMRKIGRASCRERV